MRSGELASLAGVTVRTLRHYHKVGLMPEPSRSDNGYRDYQACDLLRLLRIRQLVALGFSLDTVSTMLAELDAERAGASASEHALTADAQLAQLDRALARQIAELERQRQRIAHLRARASSADFPERAQGALAALERLRAAAQSPGFLEQVLSQKDRLGLGIAAHLYSDGELAEMERVFNAVVDRGLAARYAEASSCLERLGDDAPRSARVKAYRTCMDFLVQIEDCFDPVNWLREDTACERVLEQAAAEDFNAAQRRVSARIFDELTARISARVRNA
ncbi:MAG: MerR family transcriptional regulator [Coriobacteriaceae bacterium]|nr:MerR family transcriptional regulator [Coriobacteriaceae bacterium]